MHIKKVLWCDNFNILYELIMNSFNIILNQNFKIYYVSTCIDFKNDNSYLIIKYFALEENKNNNYGF